MTTLNLYLPPSSPLFSYPPDIPDIPGGNFTGTWQGVASSGSASSATGGAWGNTTSGSDAEKGNVEVTNGNSAILLNSLHCESADSLLGELCSQTYSHIFHTLMGCTILICSNASARSRCTPSLEIRSRIHTTFRPNFTITHSPMF